MRSNFANLLFTACLLAGTWSVQAAPITLDFRGGDTYGLGTGNLGSSIANGQAGSINFQVRGEDRDPGNDNDPNRADFLHRSANLGLGVTQASGGNNVGPDESIFIDFAPLVVVALTSLVFEKGDPNQGALELWVDGNFSRRISWRSGGGTFATQSLRGVAGSVFEFRGKKKKFRLASLTVEDTFGIPSPPVLPLMVLGLGALRLRRHLPSLAPYA
ncbi:MAG: hypothetical protein AAF384_09725 [Pseudomonadota bacterium]